MTPNSETIRSLSQTIAEFTEWATQERTLADFIEYKILKWQVDLNAMEIAQLKEKCDKLHAERLHTYEDMLKQHELYKARLKVYPKLVADISKDYNREATRRAALERELELLRKQYEGLGK